MNEELELLPVSEESANRVRIELQKLKLVSDIESFISVFNSGMLNSNLTPVSDLAKLIADSYKNVSYNNKKLVVHSEAEISFDDAITILTNFKLLSSLKRLATSIINESYPEDTKMLFKKDSPGVLHLEYFRYNESKGENEKNIEPYWQKEKLFSRHNELEENMFLKTLVYDYEGEDKFLELKDVIDIDDSFIIDVYSLIKESAFKGL